MRKFLSILFILSILGAYGGCSSDDVSLSSIAITPANPSIAKETTQQFTATGTYSDNSTKDITSTATWASGTTTVATIDANGLATGVAAGTSAITATQGDISGTTGLTVTGATLVSLAVTPVEPAIAKGATRQFTATGTYSDATTQDITSSVTWTSGTATVATIDANGLATGIDAGVSVITAALGDISGTTSLIVPSVYVAGYCNNTAAIWKDGVKIDLTVADYSYSYANSVYVSGGDVYVVGYYYNGANYIAVVWKNGEYLEDLTVDGHDTTIANSIYVSGADVYVAGYYYNGANSIAAVWKNSELLEDLAIEGCSTFANSIYISDGKVYVAGYCSATPTTAVVWVDGANTELPGTTGVADSVYVSGGDVYVAGSYVGTEYPIAAIWKGNEKTDLTNESCTAGAEASSVYVSDGSVYVAGYCGSTRPTDIVAPFKSFKTVALTQPAAVWKDGVKVEDLTVEDNATVATSVYVSSDDIYVAGYNRPQMIGDISKGMSTSAAVVWKNGVMTTLSDDYAVATSVYLSDKLESW